MSNPTPVKHHATRRTETPNTVMTTLASPTLGPSEHLSLWQVEMQAGQSGPPHTFDSEQVWYVVDGEVEITVQGTAHPLEAGDTLVLPAGFPRRVAAITDTRLIVCGLGDAFVSVPGEDQPRGTPPWIS